MCERPCRQFRSVFIGESKSTDFHKGLPSSSSCFAQLIDALRQVKCGLDVAQLVERQGNLDVLIPAGIKLRQRDAIVKGVDNHILIQGRFALIYKGNDGRVIIVFDGKHGTSLAGRAGRCNQS